ncbi:MAG TPA: ABC transporter permease [Candidatus Angelobacter sp.]|jgi:putative ABC transport system permease protein|nr:ABC transporter permease [Candidatus Angelobacter sp.]
MLTLAQNFRFALRRLKNNPGFTVVAVLTLALGIGANTAMFSIVNAVLLRPLPYRDPQRLMLLAEHWPQFPRLSLSYPNYKDWRDQSHSFEAIGAVRNDLMTMTGGSEAERLPSQYVTANLFDLLGVKPESGRAFSDAEDKPGAPPVALISHSLWERRFSSSQGVLGQTITLDNQNYSIIGVMPLRFEILQQAVDVFLPFEPWARTLPEDRSWHPGIFPIARLKSDVSLEQARSEIAVIAKRLEQQYPQTNNNVSSLVDPMLEQIVQNVHTALWFLIGAVGAVLLIACANVANLLLVRATGRRREMAVCIALGARRGDIIRQLLTESVLVAIAGGLLGLALAWAAVPLVVRLAGSSLPRSNNISIDLWVLGFTALIALLAGILFGLAPARHTWSIDLRETLNETNRGGSVRAVLRIRAALVVAEIAIAMFLLVGAGLLFKSFARLSQVSPGFSTDHILIANIVRSPAAYSDRNVRLAFFDRLFEQLSALPGVRSVGAVTILPVTGAGAALHFNIQGRPPRSPADYTIGGYRAVSAGYLKTLGVPLITGRWIEDRDREGAPAVVVVNSSFARTYFPNQSPIGQHIQLGASPSPNVPWMEIVGIIADVKQSLASESSSEMYLPFRQADQLLPVTTLSLVVRTVADPLAQSEPIRSAVHNIDPNQPLTAIRSMEENIAQSISQPRFRTVLLAVFAGIALALAAVGIFGVMAYSVAQRTRELGLRIALGASRGRVLQLVMAHGVRLTLVGVAIGLAGTFLLIRFVSSFLFNVPAYDPMTLVGVVAALIVISLCACYLPARRATLVDPIVALREE